MSFFWNLDKVYKNNILRGLDPIGLEKESSANEKLERLYNIWREAGYPTLTSKNSIANIVAGKGRPMYSGLNNKMYNIRNLQSYIDEISHAYQRNNPKVQNEGLGLWSSFDLLPSDIKIQGKSGYGRPTHTEYKAHHLLEPKLWKYLSEGVPTGYYTPDRKYAEGGNLFDGGSQMKKKKTTTVAYTPSEGVKNRIAKWEGTSMWKAAADTGRVNRSFEDEARDFYNVLPKDVRGYLTQDALDALYSYSYNVGAGNFKKRVVPHLAKLRQALASGKDVDKAIEAITSNMYGTKDSTLRGLNNRRAFEREAFSQAIQSQLNGGKNRVNWGMDETKVKGYKSQYDWTVGKKDEWDAAQEALHNELMNARPQVDMASLTLPQGSIPMNDAYTQSVPEAVEPYNPYEETPRTNPYAALALLNSSDITFRSRNSQSVVPYFNLTI